MSSFVPLTPEIKNQVRDFLARFYPSVTTDQATRFVEGESKCLVVEGRDVHAPDATAKEGAGDEKESSTRAVFFLDSFKTPAYAMPEEWCECTESIEIPADRSDVVALDYLTQKLRAIEVSFPHPEVRMRDVKVYGVTPTRKYVLTYGMKKNVS